MRCLGWFPACAVSSPQRASRIDRSAVLSSRTCSAPRHWRSVRTTTHKWWPPQASRGISSVGNHRSEDIRSNSYFNQFENVEVWEVYRSFLLQNKCFSVDGIQIESKSLRLRRRQMRHRRSLESCLGGYYPFMPRTVAMVTFFERRTNIYRYKIHTLKHGMVPVQQPSNTGYHSGKPASYW